MSTFRTNAKASLGRVLVVGGCGFVGSHVVDILRSECDAAVFVLSRNSSKASQKYDDVQYFDADITFSTDVSRVFEQVKPDVVIHTVSPPPTTGSAKQFHQVNVKGTRCLLEASMHHDVKAFVYTSSSTVIKSYQSQDLPNADETWPVITGPAQEEPYLRSKAEAETLVLATNRHSSLLTCALRAAAIFGERDKTITMSAIRFYNTGQTRLQIGDNRNLFDWTYVGNHAYAHILAAQALLEAHASSTPLPKDKRVEGEVFYTTNDEPRWHFWDFNRAMYTALAKEVGDGPFQVKPKVLAMWQALILAFIMTWVYWFMGKKSDFTTANVYHCCRTAYFNNSKAKQRLGYRVRVPLDEAVRRTAKWFVEQGAVESQSSKAKEW